MSEWIGHYRKEEYLINFLKLILPEKYFSKAKPVTPIHKWFCINNGKQILTRYYLSRLRLYA